MKSVLVDNEIHSIWLEDGIMFASYKPGTVVTMEIADRVIEERLEISQGKSYPLCGDVSPLVKVTKEARDRLGEAEAFEGITALGIVVNNYFVRAIAKFYMAFSKKGPVPTKIFANHQSATFWLQTFNNRN